MHRSDSPSRARATNEVFPLWLLKDSYPRSCPIPFPSSDYGSCQTEVLSQKCLVSCPLLLLPFWILRRDSVGSPSSKPCMVLGLSMEDLLCSTASPDPTPVLGPSTSMWTCPSHPAPPGHCSPEHTAWPPSLLSYLLFLKGWTI